MTTPHFRRLGLTTAFTVVALGAYHLGKAYASGIPTTNPLVYAGTLLNNGQPASSPQNIGLSLWTDPTSTTSQVCDVPSGAVTIDAFGRFSVPLNAACLTAVGANPDIYVEVDVSGAQVGARTHLGAVPYAVEANHAVTASSAANVPTVLPTATPADYNATSATPNVWTFTQQSIVLPSAGTYWVDFQFVSGTGGCDQGNQTQIGLFGGPDGGGLGSGGYITGVSGLAGSSVDSVMHLSTLTTVSGPSTVGIAIMPQASGCQVNVDGMHINAIQFVSSP